MQMVEGILNNTTPYGKTRASYEGSLHSSTLIRDISDQELISCLHDQFTIRHVHGGDSLYLYTLFKKSTFKC